MLLRQGEAMESSESRFDRETLAKVTALASRLQARHQETLTAQEMEAVGAEVGLAPNFVREALAQVALQNAVPLAPQVMAPSRSRNYGKAWKASLWTLPFVLMFLTSSFNDSGPSTLSLALFFVGWAIYIGGAVLLSHPKEQPQPAPVAGPVGPPRASVSRLAMLETLFAIQRELQGQKRFAAYLSLDVANSTDLKRGADELNAEYSFGQFNAWACEVVIGCGGEVQFAVGNGIMCRFPSDTLAVRAARQLQEGLAAFNNRSNRLPLPFRIRCGISAGQVPFEDATRAGYVHSAVIDRAAALQAQASADDILVSREIAAAAITELGSLFQVPGPYGSEPALSWRGRGG